MTAARSRSAKPRRLSFRWTLTRKIYAVGFFSLLALVSLSGASLLTTTWIVTATTQSEERQADILVAKGMLVKQLNVDIAVGDILFNSASGKIDTKVMDQINLDITSLNETAGKLRKAATTTEQERLVASIREQNDDLALAIQVDLPMAVEFGGDRKDLVRVNVLIKERVGALRGNLDRLEKLFQQEAKKAGEVARQTANVSRIGSGIAFLVVATVLMIIQIVLGRSIAKPITAMTRSMLRLAGGDQTVEIPAIGRKDEVGEMANAVQVFKEGMIEADRLTEEQRREQEARAERTKRIEDLCKAFDATSTEAVKSVATAATEMRSSSEAMSATAEETTRQASAVAAASEQASANVATVASAAEELSGSIAEISRQVTQASQIAAAAVSEAEQTNVKVQGLAQAANKIGEVVALITD
ncbi:MAG: HAMP domain-containing protein, partial [Rhodospirillales bacterium]|nr:HAMP domain-containing protein [Rhodospirillales bacterium]